MDYLDFIGAKRAIIPPSGFAPVDLADYDSFAFQQAIAGWLCEQGRGAAFADTGLGKSRIQLAVADQVCRHTGGRYLILAPLAVGPQTVREAAAVNIDGVQFARNPDEVKGEPRIVVTNYDNLDKWDRFGESGVGLDESSILKNFMGSTKARLTDRFSETRFKAAYTATPAPNDYTEIGTHAEWLGVCSRAEMLATYFVNDVDGKKGAKTANEWRLKGHAVDAFWNWVASWSRMVGKPSDIGDFDDSRYVLPPLRIHKHLVNVDIVDGRDGALFRMSSGSATEIKREQKRTAGARAARVAEIVASRTDTPWLVWITGDADGAAMREAMPGICEVHGSDTPDVKERRLLDFADGKIPVLMTKGSIAGMGLNFQVCSAQAFMGIDYSYERFYQQVRRSWRFMQQNAVDAHIVIATTEAPVLATILDKQAAHVEMKSQMFAASRRAVARGATSTSYYPTHIARLPAWLESK